MLGATQFASVQALSKNSNGVMGATQFASVLALTKTNKTGTKKSGLIGATESAVLFAKETTHLSPKAHTASLAQSMKHANHWSGRR